MSLVAYAASSSDEGSDCDDYMGQSYAKISLNKTKGQDQTDTTKLAGQISDDDESDFAPVEVPLARLKQFTGCVLALPMPKNANAKKEFEDKLMANLDNLPLPKPSKVGKEEDDDEFLRKKVEPQDDLKMGKPIKNPVKIYLTSLQEFSDVDKVVPTNKTMLNSATTYIKNSSGLLSILPQAKSEQDFTKSSPLENKQMVKKVTPFKELPFVPDTVRSRRSALNTESIDGIKAGISPSNAASKHMNAGTATARPLLVDCSDSEDSEDEDRATKQSDFFSLAKEEKLPEVSANEISAMVARRTAKMAQATNNYLHAASTRPSGTAVATSSNEAENDCEEKQHRQTQMGKNMQPLDTNAMQALIGSRAKRVRRNQEDINVMDISSDQVLPNREEWMRSALASSTTYQPTGVLVDEEPATGTRRKHQITYLAHKAKANEAELQAMWAVNRQNRRATQSKYGF